MWELAFTEYLDSLCECGVTREECMDRSKAWLVDFRIGYRCQALMRVQHKQSKEDEPLIKNGIPVFPEARKWSATEYHEVGSPGDGREDSPG